MTTATEEHRNARIPLQALGWSLGIAETLLYGWFVALIFGPLFNFFAERS